jgi:uncharacterized protein (TIGR01777 family)
MQFSRVVENTLNEKNKMRILISGSSGMVGTAVTRLLAENGHTVSRLLRRQSKGKLVEAVLPVEKPLADVPTVDVQQILEPAVEPSIEAPVEAPVEQPVEETVEVAVEELINRDIEVPAYEIPKDVRWDPVTNEFDAQAAEGADAVIHLAGASIGGGRWTNARKALLRSSRVEATHHLVDSLSALSAKPKVFVGVSAVGYYGNRGDEKLTDHSGPGTDFLAQICKDWERESNRAAEFGARVVILRFGIILSTRGGALPRMLTPIKMFVGGKLGSGQQWMSWISLDDVAGIIRFALENESVRGPINAVSPYPIRNADFTKKAANAVHRPAIFPAPAFALHLMLGEMADGLLLGSQRALPEKSKTLGYEFQDSDLGFTLARLISERK